MAGQLERRAGFGSRGRVLNVMSNCFKVSRRPDMMVQQYDVAFSDAKVKDKRVVMKYLIETERIFGNEGVGAVFDGQAILYIPGSSPRPQGIFKVNENQAKGRPVVSRPGAPPPTLLEVKITHANEINLSELGEYVQARVGNTANIFQAINALNVALKYYPSGMHPSRKSSFFVDDDRQKRIISGGLEVWAGYFTSIRPGIGMMIMNFDRAAGAFKQSGNAIDILLKLIGRNDPRELDLSRMPPREKLKVTRFLKNLTITLKFRNPDAKYKIRKVSDVSAADFLFDNNGQQYNVARYIEDRYNIRLQFPFLPCVQVTKIAWYPLETVMICPGTQFLGKLGPEQVTEMLKFTTQKPNEKLASLRNGLTHLQLGGSNATLRAWNFDVEQRPINVKARLLDSPTLNYTDARSNQVSRAIPKDGAWDVRGHKATRACLTIEKWAVVVFADNAPSREGFPIAPVQQSITDLVRGCRDFGVFFSNERPYIQHVGNTMDVRRAITDTCKKAGYGPQNLPQLVVTYCINKSSPQYKVIKQVCDQQLGIASQNMLIQKVRSAKTQYYSNVALKVNIKLNGVNQAIQGGLPGFTRVPTIVFGADVTHPGPGSLLPSIASVVASHDPHGLEYTTEVRAQNSREEIIIDLEDMARALIKNYYRMSKRQPARLLFFRDGVSEGQFDEVCRREIAAIKAACSSFPDYHPALTYIVCGKRHHVKLFPTNPNDNDKSGNLKAGAVVDGDITHPYYNDFYLLSHGGLLGTSRPTHYSVLLDESKLGPDQLQATAFYLAHIYPRSTRSVSIAAPAYYAHHACFRARAHIGDDDTSASELSFDASPEQEDRMRNEKLTTAQERLRKAVHDNLFRTMYFM